MKRGKEKTSKKTKNKKSFKDLKKKIIIFSIVIILVLLIFFIVTKGINITGNAPGDPQCVPNWKCSEFFPQKCPAEGIRTRTCIDLNDCGTIQGKPELTENCERKSPLILILIGILIFAAIELSTNIIRRIFRKKEKLKERPKASDKHYKKHPNYPSDVEQYYSSDQTHNYKSDKKTKNPKKDEEETQETFPEKYWPK